MYTWKRKHKNGYEVSSKGDKRFSAFYAKLNNGKSIEYIYQCDIKGYNSIKEGKGQIPLIEHEDIYQEYKNAWKEFFYQNTELLMELHQHLKKHNITVITDMFANSPINQARAISDILNECFI